MNNLLISKIYSTELIHNVFTFQVLLTCRRHMIRSNKTNLFPWNSKNTSRNGINKQNTHRHTKHSEKDNMSKQALAYEVCECMRMPLHMPKTETCKKSRPCLIQKASRCVADNMSKATTFFYLSLSIKHKDHTRKLCVLIFYVIGSVVKIVCFYFLYIKDNRPQKNYKETWMMELLFFWYLYLSSFLLKKRLWHRHFPVNFVNFLKMLF